jgi:DNA/RNA endonuclease YhcR with UshA esterase domain
MMCRKKRLTNGDEGEMVEYTTMKTLERGKYSIIVQENKDFQESVNFQIQSHIMRLLKLEVGSKTRDWIRSTL